MDGMGGMNAMQMMMPMMMVMYMQQNQNGTLYGQDIKKQFNGTDPFAMIHHSWFPVPTEGFEDLHFFWKFMYYCPWIELLMIFGIIGGLIGAVLYFCPKVEEEAPEEEGEKEQPAGETVAEMRSILESTDDDDAEKLAKIRELVGNRVEPKSLTSAADSTTSGDSTATTDKKND